VSNSRSLTPTPSASGGTLMERMVEERAIPFGSPAYRQGLRQFRSNLSDLLARYEEADLCGR